MRTREPLPPVVILCLWLLAGLLLWRLFGAL